MKCGKLALNKAVMSYIRKKPIRFHMPGHKGKGIPVEKRGFFINENIHKWDVTEIYGLDNLHEPSGPIKYSQERLAKLYGADLSFFLVNGASSGIEAILMSCLRPNQKIILPRTCHKSIVYGIIMSGALPVYIIPEWDENLKTYTQVSLEKVKKAFCKNPGITAALFVNPTYLGFCPDIRLARKITNKYKSILLVDEAHGPHFAFSHKLPKSAGQINADAWVQSPHKMLCSLTQSAWMHMKGCMIDPERLRQSINLVTTTSPSYILMASLDRTREIMEKRGKQLVEKALSMSESTRRKINAHTPFYCIGSEVKGDAFIHDIDLSRLVVNVSCAGYTGFEVERLLRKKFNISAEYADNSNICFLVTFCNSPKEMKKLVYALSKFKKKKVLRQPSLHFTRLPQKALSPREAFFSDGEWVLLKYCTGRIVQKPIVVYPPGVPCLMPGEIIEEEHIEMVQQLLNCGISCEGLRDGKVLVTKKG